MGMSFGYGHSAAVLKKFSSSEENCLVNENVVNQSWREGEVQEDVQRHASVRVQN